MKIIDFDIEKAKSGEYEIVTENGAPVRIICWDKQDGVFKLVGLVKDTDGDEFCQSYDEHGDAREGDTSFNLRLVCSDPVSELTDFEYKVGVSMYGSYIDEMNEEGLDCVRATARELLDLAKMELYDEAWFDSHNEKEIDVLKSDGMCDENKPTKMFIDEFKEYIETALWGRWQSTSLGGVSGIRYTVQGGVIYDCVGAKEIPINKVIEVLLNALNHRTDDSVPNLKDVRYDSLERKDDIDVINKHITNSQLSDEINTRLNNCGWFVCDKNNIRGLIEYLAEIEKNM